MIIIKTHTWIKVEADLTPLNDCERTGQRGERKVLSFVSSPIGLFWKTDIKAPSIIIIIFRLFSLSFHIYNMTAIETSVPYGSTLEEPINQEDILIEQEESLQLVTELRASADWEEVVAYEHLSPSARAHSLTATTLRGQDMIVRRPIKFFNKNKTACVMAIYFGANL